MSGVGAIASCQKSSVGTYAICGFCSHPPTCRRRRRRRHRAPASAHVTPSPQHPFSTASPPPSPPWTPIGLHTSMSSILATSRCRLRSRRSPFSITPMRPGVSVQPIASTGPWRRACAIRAGQRSWRGWKRAVLDAPLQSATNGGTIQRCNNTSAKAISCLKSSTWSTCLPQPIDGRPAWWSCAAKQLFRDAHVRRLAFTQRMAHASR